MHRLPPSHLPSARPRLQAEYAAFLHSKLIVTLWEHLADEELLYELVASGAISANLAAAESFLGDLLQALRAGPGGLSCPLRINAVLREILQDFEELYFSVTGGCGRQGASLHRPGIHCLCLP